MKNSSPKKIRHHLLIAGLSSSNNDIMEHKKHPIFKVFSTLLSLLFIGGLTYLFIWGR